MSKRHYLERVRELTLEQGWTVSSPVTEGFLRQADAWGFPKYPDRTVILPPDADLIAALGSFIVTNTVFLQETNCWLGTWVHPDKGDIYLNVTTSCKELGEALHTVARINAASKRNIIAVYNSSLDETVYL